jgi:alpha-N-arabinofuranosidase
MNTKTTRAIGGAVVAMSLAASAVKAQPVHDTADVTAVLKKELPLSALPAAELHVAITGNDASPGTSAAPLRTIQHAADLAQPGDTVTVHAGVYRERVNPPRGGESDTKRIVYQAASGEQVVITGSEAVKKWEKVQDGVWKATIPNALFGSFNPFAELITGDWFDAKGRIHHAGAVYLNGDWLTEAVSCEEVLKPMTATPLWFASVDKTSTVIWAQFKGVDPNAQQVEVNARRTVFYPDKPGRDFITVRGFTLRNAATPWAPPTVEQIGLIGVHWSKGWIIENNDIAYSTCSGITLGKYGDAQDQNSGSAKGYVKTIERGLQNGWNKETVGHHMLRNNHIAHCEQAGIVGSLGAAFSTVTGNAIHDIHVRQLFSGAEMAGIKFHGPIDVTISGNHIYRTCRGMWLDWMTQGTRISANLCHDNAAHDLFVEVNHGPFVVDNNLFLSRKAIEDDSQGGAYVHNLIAGVIDLNPAFYDGRKTPFHKAHSTEVVALHDNPSGDSHYDNNLFMGCGGLGKYDQAQLPMWMDGNMFFQGTQSSKHESAPINRRASDPGFALAEKNNGFHLTMTIATALGSERPSRLVTSERLGKAGISGCAFENPDGSPITIGTDYFGKPRSVANPTPGPFEAPGTGMLTLKVWPLAPTQETK